MSSPIDRVTVRRGEDWLRDQLLTLAGYARYAPERWPTHRYTTAVLAIAAGDKNWRDAAYELQLKEG